MRRPRKWPTFHALKAAYITNPVASGASVKVCQTLARHSDPSLTIGVYAKASLHDIQGVVERLPDLTSSGSSSEPLAMTGTDPVLTPISKRFAHHLPTEGDVSGPPESVQGVIGESKDWVRMLGSTRENEASDTSSRSESVASGIRARRTQIRNRQKSDQPPG